MSEGLTVNESEAPLITLAGALFEQLPEARLRPMLEVGRRIPQRLSRGGLEVLQQALGKGAVQFLARAGAWRKVGAARLWERVDPVPLVFTGASFHLLRWLSGSGDQPDLAPMIPTAMVSSGDEVLALAVLAATAGTPWQTALAYQPLVRSSALCAVGFAAVLGGVRELEYCPRIDLTPGGWHAFALEACGELFAAQWAEAEFEKTHEPSPQRLRQMSLAQAVVLDQVLGAAGSLPARVPLTFLLEAGRTVLNANVGAQDYGGGLTARSPLRERSEARLASGAFLRGLMRVQAMDEEHRQARFIDEGYDAARALVARWESVGPSRAQWARVEPMVTELGAA